MTFLSRLRAFFGGASPNGGGADQEMISCHEALSLVHEFLDGELDDVPNEQVEAHFEVCERCYPHLRLEKTFREALSRAAAGKAAPPELRDAVMKALAQAGSGDDPTAEGEG